MIAKDLIEMLIKVHGIWQREGFIISQLFLQTKHSTQNGKGPQHLGKKSAIWVIFSVKVNKSKTFSANNEITTFPVCVLQFWNA